MSKADTGAAPRKRGQPETHSLTPTMTPAAAAVNGDPLRAAIREEARAILEPYLLRIEELVSGQRQGDIRTAQELCQYLQISAPTLRKMVESGCPHLVFALVKRFSTSAVEKWLSERSTK